MEEFDRRNVRCDLDVIEILREGRRLIEAGWCQGTNARDARKRELDLDSANAALFDPLGAIERAVLNLLGGDRRYLTQNYYKGFYALAWGLHTHSAMVAWNDDPIRRKEDVLSRFDRAMKRSSPPPTPRAPRPPA